MSIRAVVTRGYGNGTFNGTIGEVVTQGYSIAIPTFGSFIGTTEIVRQFIGTTEILKEYIGTTRIF